MTTIALLCGCNQVNVAESNINEPIINNLELSQFKLPGIENFIPESYANSLGLSELANIYGCTPTSTGPYVRKQSPTFSNSTINYVEFDAYLPSTVNILSYNDDPLFYPYLYSGGQSISAAIPLGILIVEW